MTNRARPRHPIRTWLLLPLLATGALPAQEWTDQELIEVIKGVQKGAKQDPFAVTVQLMAHLKEATPAIAARIHGDHREYLLKIDRLIGELSNARWQVREQAERTLIEIGANAQAILQQHADKGETLEESMRCGRILDAINARNTAEEVLQTKILRDLTATAFYMPASERLLRALRSALGHTDPQVVACSIRALGRHGTADEADAVFQMIDWKNGAYRNGALPALASMPNERALALCEQLLRGDKLDRAETCAVLRCLRRRADGAKLAASLADAKDPVVAAAARLQLPPAAERPRVLVRLVLPDRTNLDGEFGGFEFDGTWLQSAVAGLPRVHLPFAECDTLDFPAATATPSADARVFLTQGTLVTGRLDGMDEDTVRITSSVFGSLQIPRREVQGIAVDPQLERLVGASVDHDRLRLRTNEFVDGHIAGVAGGEVEVVTATGSSRFPLAEVAGLLTVRPRSVEPDTTVYTRIDLTTGDRMIGFLVGGDEHMLALSVPLLGAAIVPIERVMHVETGVGGGAMWGFTLIADYSDNCVLEVDDQGHELLRLPNVYGAWDAEALDNGNLLLTEFSVSRVEEVDRKRNVLWFFDELKNPYDADRLPNGNTLIADTFGGRVIEVNREKQIVWKYDNEIRPFDCDRLANGNTLIADAIKDRVIEVNPAGEIVWQVTGMHQVHDADRLPNGNTLITLRGRGSVIEVDRDGKVVWELTGLSSPSDADRLPNGHTIVAENNEVREFDRRKNVVWHKEMTWAVEVNRY